MKKNYSLLFLMFLLFHLQAQTSEFRVQGVSRKASSLSLTTKSTLTPQLISVTDTTFTMDNIVNWIGKGSKRAALVVQWNDLKQPDAMVWGYRWDGVATGADMIKAITKADPRFFLLIKEDYQGGTTIGGIGYDLNQKNRIKVYMDCFELKASERIFNTYNFGKTTCSDNQNHWCSNWINGFWSYTIRESHSVNFFDSKIAVTERVLLDGSWDGWWYNNDESKKDPVFLDKFTASSTIDYTKGVFFLNEDWFGFDNGTLNYLNPNGEFSYRVYRKENEAATKLGVKSDFGTIFDQKLFVISKQHPRVVVADAKTLKNIATIDEIKSPSGQEADGRAFLGITPELGYISTSNGICTINLKNHTIGEFIAGTDGETGNMIRSELYVFAVQKNRVLILKDHAVVSTITGCRYSSICQSKDGMVWIATGRVLIKLDPVTLVLDRIMLPIKATIGSSWDSWNAGSFCAATQKNALYWTNSEMFGAKKDVYCYEIGSIFSLANPIYSLPQGQVFAGAGIRVHPITNLMYITSTNASIGNLDQNRVHVIDASTGKHIDEYELIPYKWSMAMPIFPEVPAPCIAKFAPDIVNRNTKSEYHTNVKLNRAYRSGDRLRNLPVGAVIEAYNMSGALCFKLKADHSEIKIPQKGFLIFNIISEDGIQVIK